MADRIWVCTLRIALNERSALAQPRSQVFSPTRRSVGKRTREPWERGYSLLTFLTDFICHSLENLLKFSQSEKTFLKKLLSQCLLGLQAGTPLVIVFKESPVLVYFWAPSVAWMGLHFHDWGDYNGILFFI